jgi:hypothetical protein
LRYTKEASSDETQINKIMNHRSETELDNIVFDIYLKNDFSDKFNQEILTDL